MRLIGFFAAGETQHQNLEIEHWRLSPVRDKNVSHNCVSSDNAPAQLHSHSFQICVCVCVCVLVAYSDCVVDTHGGLE